MRLLITFFILFTTIVPAWADITTGLVGWWKFDETSTQNGVAGIIDSSGNAKTGTWSGPPSVVAGRVGPRALNFNGTSDAVSLPSFSLGNGSTYSVWAMGGSQTANNWNYLIFGAGRIELGTWGNSLVFKDNGAPGTPSVGGRSIVDNNWHHVVGILRAATMELWVDGALQASAAYSAGQSFSGVFYAGYGLNGVDRYWQGQLDDVRLYNRDLTATDVRELYEQSCARIGSAHIVNASIGH